MLISIIAFEFTSGYCSRTIYLTLFRWKIQIMLSTSIVSMLLAMLEKQIIIEYAVYKSYNSRLCCLKLLIWVWCLRLMACVVTVNSDELTSNPLLIWIYEWFTPVTVCDDDFISS